MRPLNLVDRHHVVRAGWLLGLLLVVFPMAESVGGSHLFAEEAALDAAARDTAELDTAELDTAANGSASEQKASSLSRRDALIASVTIFVLAVFVGFEVITKVPPTLHTPLMSGSNAISGITLVGALLAAGALIEGESRMLPVLGALAVVMATINVVGGFLVTHRMLSMFRRK